MIQLKEEEKKQIINFDHHMGLWLSNIRDPDSASGVSDIFDLADHDIVSESLDYRTSSSSSGGFRLGNADSISCNLDIIRGGENPTTELDLTGKCFELYLTNELYENGAPMRVDYTVDPATGEYTKLIGECARYDIVLPLTGYTKAANGCTMEIELKAYHGEHVVSRTGVFELKRPFVRLCGYINIWLHPVHVSSEKLDRIEITCASQDYIPEISTTEEIAYSDMTQCSKIFLGDFIVAECSMDDSSIRRKLSAYELNTYLNLDEEITYGADKVVYISDVLRRITAYPNDPGNQRLLLPSDAVTMYTSSRIAHSSIDLDEEKEYKFEVPGDGKVTFVLGKSKASVSMEEFGQLRASWIPSDQDEEPYGIRYYLNLIQGEDFLYLPYVSGETSFPKWVEAYASGGNNSVKYLMEHMEDIFHGDPGVEINGETVSFEYWRLIRASYTGNLLWDLDDDFVLSYTADGTSTDSCDLAELAYDIEPSGVSSLRVEIAGYNEESTDTFETVCVSRELTCRITYGNANLLALDGLPSYDCEFYIRLADIRSALIRDLYIRMSMQGLCSGMPAGVDDPLDPEYFFSVYDYQGFVAIYDKVTEILWGMPHTSDPGGDYIVVSVSYDSTLGSSTIDPVDFIGKIEIFSAGRFLEGGRHILLTDDQEYPGVYTYYPRDNELDYLTKRVYTEKLANLSFKAKQAGSFKLRDVLAAYAELKGTLYDAKDKRLVAVKLPLCPAEDLFPATDLYPESINGRVGELVTIGDLLEIFTGLFPNLLLFPSETLYPLVESDVEGGDCNIIRKLDYDRFEEPIEYGGMMMETVDGWNDAVIHDNTKEIYEISNYITRNCPMPESYKQYIYENIWAVLDGLSIPSISAAIVSIPWMELGDRLYLEYNKWPDQLLIYDRRIKGIQAAVDEIDQIIK